MTDSILDDLFQACALNAFLKQAHDQQGWPDAETTRQLAYRMYEQALAEKNESTTPTSDLPKVNV
jgi:hypothetical protein